MLLEGPLSRVEVDEPVGGGPRRHLLHELVLVRCFRSEDVSVAHQPIRVVQLFNVHLTNELVVSNTSDQRIDLITDALKRRAFEVTVQGGPAIDDARLAVIALVNELADVLAVLLSLMGSLQ